MTLFWDILEVVKNSVLNVLTNYNVGVLITFCVDILLRIIPPLRSAVLVA